MQHVIQISVHPHVFRRTALILSLQRFKFRTIRQDAGETHPVVIPVGPKYGMQMLVD